MGEVSKSGLFGLSDWRQVKDGWMDRWMTSRLSRKYNPGIRR